jgi:hypothetical protein
MRQNPSYRNDFGRMPLYPIRHGFRYPTEILPKFRSIPKGDGQRACCRGSRQIAVVLIEDVQVCCKNGLTPLSEPIPSVLHTINP